MTVITIIPERTTPPNQTAAMEPTRTLTAPDGATLFYRLLPATHNPSRRVAVLLHGMASNYTRWSEFVEFTSLKETWDILCPDLRGHNESFTRGRIGMRRWCADLDAVLAKAGYDNGVFVGHSLGAQVAVEFAARYPGRVSGLVLIDPIFRPALHGQALAIRKLWCLFSAASNAVRLLNTLGFRRRRIPKRNLRQLDEQTRARLLDAGKQEEMVKLYTSPLADLQFFPTANYLQEFVEVTRPLPSLRDIPVPTLVLLSESKTFTDPEITRALLAPLDHVEVERIPAHHWPLTEKPAEVRQAIERWCARRFG
jgi:esterase